MVTNYPQRMASQEGLRTTSTARSASGGWFESLSRWLSQVFCGFKGHDTLLHFEDERMSLRCVSCGYESPGWELNEVPPTVTVRGDARRHAIVRPQLIRERRIA
jgi:hypothetical protein